MKRLVVSLVIAAVMAPLGAGAQFTPDPDVVGVFFDDLSLQVETFIGPGIPFFAFVTLLNPSSAEVLGFEFGYWLEGSDLSGKIVRLQNGLPPNAIDVGDNADLVSGDYVVGLATPAPGEASVVLVQWQFMLLVPATIHVQLGPPRNQSIEDGFPAYEGGGVIIPMYLASSCAGEGRALINEDCGVAIDPATFGAVKALYR